MILTRPCAASTAFQAEHGPWPKGLDIVTSPLLEIVGTGAEIDLNGVASVIFTSQNGVAHAGPAGPMPAFCVGAATTKAACDAGWRATFAGDTSQDLVDTLKHTQPATPILHIGGVHRRGDVAVKLTQAGLPTCTVDVYDQRLQPLTDEARAALEREVPKIVPLFSPRTARQFAQQAGSHSAVHFVAISDTVLHEVADLPAASCDVARTANAQSLAETLRKVLHRVETGDIPQ